MLSKSEIKYIQSLGHKKSREENQVFLTEGVKLVDELLRWCPSLLVRLYATEQGMKRYSHLVPAALCIEITEEELERISQLQTPNQVVAIVQEPAAVLPSAVDGWCLALDGIRDPGNLGTIIRLADWFGIDHIICSDDCVDYLNPKVVQASMGSIFRVQVHYTALAAWLRAQQVPVLAATLHGTPLQEQVFPPQGVLLIGSESHGIRDAVLQEASHQITIPAMGDAESLNAAVATGIMLWELRRQ